VTGKGPIAEPRYFSVYSNPPATLMRAIWIYIFVRVPSTRPPYRALDSSGRESRSWGSRSAPRRPLTTGRSLTTSTTMVVAFPLSG
jgi:hypothetical protein